MTALLFTALLFLPHEIDASEVDSIDVETEWGDIDVRVGDGSTIRIDLTSVGGRATLQVDNVDRNLEIRPAVGEGFVSTHVTVLVPDRIRARLRVRRGGEIRVQGLTGGLEIENWNGSVRAEIASGNALVSAANGSIDFSVQTLAPRATYAFDTANGSVVARFPDTLAGTVDLQLGTGGLRSDFELEDYETSAGVAEGRSRLRDVVFGTGRVGDGGVVVSARVVNGEVALLRR